MAGLVALPSTSEIGVPKSAPSIWNCTDPLAVAGLTVAVKLTGLEKTEGLAEEATLRDEPAFSTI